MLPAVNNPAVPPALMETMGRAMGMELVYGPCRIYDSEHANVFGTGGISDCRHHSRIRLAPGVIKRVYEAVYVKVLAPDTDVLRPQYEGMAPRAKALYEFLFSGQGLE